MSEKNVIYKVNKLEGEKSIIFICNRLNYLAKEILEINANFTYYKQGYEYCIHNRGKSYKEQRLDLNLRLCYGNDKIEDNDFLYAYILWFSVNPKKMGIGSKIINEVIEMLKELTNIEFVIIHPNDKEAKQFWIKNNFKEDINNIIYNKRIKINTRRILINSL